MKKKTYIIIGGALVILIVVGCGLRQWLHSRVNVHPNLPSPISYRFVIDPAKQVNQAPSSPIEGGYASSEHYALESSPQQASAPVDPLRTSVTLPDQINLDVPWMSQAPRGDWGEPYQNACEEASMLMVNAYYAQRTGLIPVDEADKSIHSLVDYENKTLGDYKDTNAEQTAQILRDYFKFKDVRVLSLKSADEIKAIVGRGFPVIIPFYGKDLNNPNFSNGGPLYHMLVIKGYTNDGMFITGDPGTRKGQDYVYKFETIINAAHDWNGGKVQQGAKKMIVVLPNPASN